MTHPNKIGFNVHSKGARGKGFVPPEEHNAWVANQKALQARKKRGRKSTLDMQKRARA